MAPSTSSKLNVKQSAYSINTDVDPISEIIFSMGVANSVIPGSPLFTIMVLGF